MEDISGLWIIAQETGLPQAPSAATGASSGTAPATTGAPGSPQGGAPRPSSPMDSMMPLLFGVVLLMLLTSILGGRKEKKRRAEMMTGLKRHDRVLLASGMIGTIADIRDDEVVVKVDDSTNTRIHFMKSSIQQVLKSSSSESTPAESSAA